MQFSVIIPTKDRNEILNKSLSYLRRIQNPSDLEIIIINDSENAILLDSDNKPLQISIYRNPGQGVASARNFGVSKAKNEWLVFLDDDMWVKEDTFLKLLPFCTSESHCFNINWIYPGFFEQQLEHKPFLRYLKRYRFDSMEGWNNDPNWNHNQVFHVSYINSAFLVIHKNTFYKVGGYNTSFPFAGFEDYDMSKRLTNNGFTPFVDPQNIVFHNEADRLEIESWMERKRRGAITRRVAVSIGHEELKLKYSTPKKGFYSVTYSFRNLLLTTLKKWPKTKNADKVYFFLVNVLLGTYSYVGYNSQLAKNHIEALKTKPQVIRSSSN